MSDFEWPGDERTPTPTLPVEHQEIRVVGPPGCGKTTYLAQQTRDIAVPKYGAGAIVISSLTKAAATEIGAADLGIPRENVSTLHGHAYHALDKPNIAETAEYINRWNDSGITSSLRIDPRSSADPENVITDMVPVENSDGTMLLQRMGTLRQRCIEPEFWPPDVQAFAKKWEEFKATNDCLDFTDLISKARDEVAYHPVNPRVMMVDEAQDMSTLEMQLLRKWGAHTDRLVIVGDPDQALYTWRGADPDTVFGHDMDGVIVREQGYRVPEAVRDWSNTWIEQMPGRLPITYLPRCDENGQVVDGELLRHADNWADPTAIIDEAIKHTQEGKTVMILTTCGYMLAPTISRLRDLGQPFHNPYRVKQGAWNPLKGRMRILDYLRPSVDVWGDESRMWTWNEMHKWIEPMAAKNLLAHGAKAFVERKTHPDRFNDEAGAEEQPDMAAIAGLFKDEDTALKAMELDAGWWLQHLRHDHVKRQQFPAKVLRRHGRAGLLEKPRLMIGTIHSVKGGQADIVYLFPDLSTQGYWNGYQAGGEPRNSVLRQIYVGATRARHTLVLCSNARYEHVAW